MSIVVLKLPEVKIENGRPSRCPSCKGETFQRWGGRRKAVRDPQVKQVLVYRYRCCHCHHTFRHYPEGVDQAQQSQRLRKLAAIGWALGLSYRGIAAVFAAFGVGIGRMSAWRDGRESSAFQPFRACISCRPCSLRKTRLITWLKRYACATSSPPTSTPSPNSNVCDPALSPLLAKLGGEMESSLWRDTTQFYHADLRNLAGPYDRSYGMNLLDYVSVIGIWIIGVCFGFRNSDFEFLRRRLAGEIRGQSRSVHSCEAIERPSGSFVRIPHSASRWASHRPSAPQGANPPQAAPC